MAPVEFRIPVAPNAGFYSTVKLAALSLAKLGEPYSSAPIVVSVGDYADQDQVLADNAWSRDFPVIWRAVPRSTCDALPPGFASGGDRYDEPPRADAVILCDADACLIGRIDELLSKLRARPKIVAGMMAHFPPTHLGAKKNERTWRRVFRAAGFPKQKLRHRYSVMPPEESGYAPPYFNYGFVAFGRTAFERVRTRVNRHTNAMLAALSPDALRYFSAQIGLTLAMIESKVKVVTLGPEYNCANSDEVLGLGITDPSQIRFLHFLRKIEFDRHDFLCDPEAFERFRSARFASAINRHFQEHVLSLRDVFYANPPAGGPPSG